MFCNTWVFIESQQLYWSIRKSRHGLLLQHHWLIDTEQGQTAAPPSSGTAIRYKLYIVTYCNRNLPFSELGEY